MAALAATGRVVGVSLCCGNPRRDPDGRSAAAYARALEPLPRLLSQPPCNTRVSHTAGGAVPTFAPRCTGGRYLVADP